VAEITIGPGDSVSRLLQVIAKDVGLTGRRWHGKGMEDARAILVELYNAQLLKDALWTGLQELCQMSELKELPEAVQAKIVAIILTARAKFEIKMKSDGPPHLTPPPGGAAA
jgi:hypothetical protein